VLDNIGVDRARQVCERAIRRIEASKIQDKQNIWVAFMNMEANFGKITDFQKVVTRALEHNDKKAIYLQLISIYMNKENWAIILDIYGIMVKKYSQSQEIWLKYIEFLLLIETKELKELEIPEPRKILSRAL
jgi:hypothetical protein